MTIVHSIDSIVSDPDIQRGEPIIANSRIRVIDVVASHLYRGLSADELATNFNLDLGQVYAALAYYYQHKAELDAKLRANAEEAERLRQRLDEQGLRLSLE